MPRVGDIKDGFRAVTNVHRRNDVKYIQEVKKNGGLIKLTPLETDHYSSGELTNMGMVSVWLPARKEKEEDKG